MDSDLWSSRLAAAKRHYSLQHHQNPQSDRLSFEDFEVEEEVRPDFPCPYCYEDHDIASLCTHLEDEHAFESKVAVKSMVAIFYIWLSLVIDCFVPKAIADAKIVNLWISDGFWLMQPFTLNEYHLILAHVDLSPLKKTPWRLQVCPICSVKVARDMLSHITLQHGHLFKISFSLCDYQKLKFPDPLVPLFLERRRRLRRVAIPNSQALSLLGRDLREAHLQVLLGGGGYRSSSTTASNSVTDSFLSSLVLNFPASEAEEISKSAISTAEDANIKKAVPVQSWKSSFEPSLSNEEREKRMRQATVRASFVQDLLLSTLFID
ncbi:hypothetical protein ACLOJK_010361 [Asimina triloba]